MSLTSYRAAPPRVVRVLLGRWFGVGVWRCGCGGRVELWCVELPALGGPGGVLLSHALGRSTIGAEGFHGRVRDGIGCWGPRHDHQVAAGQAFLPASVVVAGFVWSLVFVF